MVNIEKVIYTGMNKEGLMLDVTAEAQELGVTSKNHFTYLQHLLSTEHIDLVDKNLTDMVVEFEEGSSDYFKYIAFMLFINDPIIAKVAIELNPDGVPETLIFKAEDFPELKAGQKIRLFVGTANAYETSDMVVGELVKISARELVVKLGEEEVTYNNEKIWVVQPMRHFNV